MTALTFAIGCGASQGAAPGAQEEAPGVAPSPHFQQSDVEAGLAPLGPAFIGCYQKATAKNRAESGSIIISAGIASDGHVATAVPVSSTLGAELSRCLADVVLSAHFRAPGVDGVRVKVPLAFEQADAAHDAGRDAGGDAGAR